GVLQPGERVRANRRVCPECGHHFRMPAAERIELIVDPGSFQELGRELTPGDPLGFTDRMPYPERVARAVADTGLREAMVIGTGRVDGRPVVLAVLDFGFLGGSMGAVVGEKLVRAADLASARRVPLVAVCASGGARMQEGVISLLQMAKTADAVGRLREAGVPYISVLTDPVYGGVAASFAALGDVVIAESGTRAGFAGPRVIQQTIRQKLPDGFQTADFLFSHGHVDCVVPRDRLRPTLAALIRILASSANRPRANGRTVPGRTTGPNGYALPNGNGRTAPSPARTGAARDAWECTTLARAPGRPTARDYIERIFTGFVELHGDRWSGDDEAVVGGLALLDGAPLVVLGHCKGRDTAENVRRNFGMPHPAGFRKAMRLLRLADRLGLPVVSLVDTPGAYPGVAAEEGNQSGAIAEALLLSSRLRVPLVAAVTGEGGSGGALALSAGDALLVQENTVYSVISPEGCAAILFGDASRAPEAARALRLTAADLLRLGVAEELVPEPPGGAPADHAHAAALLGAAIRRHLAELA
ncbi:MAG: acetyl-CoA carboxylase, carboxyltransferase subunit beta, partial [Actinomadura rubrobrunea]|nr:acetyl-CoA carboxylase, carboxyltransferase subunit beta [Actinomadura rubrobrunea]